VTRNSSSLSKSCWVSRGIITFRACRGHRRRNISPPTLYREAKTLSVFTEAGEVFTEAGEVSG
jgi:hypothetical protein